MKNVIIILEAAQTIDKLMSKNIQEFLRLSSFAFCSVMLIFHSLSKVEFLYLNVINSTLTTFWFGMVWSSLSSIIHGGYIHTYVRTHTREA